MRRARVASSHKPIRPETSGAGTATGMASAIPTSATFSAMSMRGAGQTARHALYSRARGRGPQQPRRAGHAGQQPMQHRLAQAASQRLHPRLLLGQQGAVDEQERAIQGGCRGDRLAQAGMLVLAVEEREGRTTGGGVERRQRGGQRLAQLPAPGHDTGRPTERGVGAGVPQQIPHQGAIERQRLADQCVVLRHVRQLPGAERRPRREGAQVLQAVRPTRCEQSQRQLDRGQLAGQIIMQKTEQGRVARIELGQQAEQDHGRFEQAQTQAVAHPPQRRGGELGRQRERGLLILAALAAPVPIAYPDHGTRQQTLHIGRVDVDTLERVGGRGPPGQPGPHEGVQRLSHGSRPGEHARVDARIRPCAEARARVRSPGLLPGVDCANSHLFPTARRFAPAAPSTDSVEPIAPDGRDDLPTYHL